MKVIIKNTNPTPAKAVLFGNYHRNNVLGHNNKFDFFDFNTSEGVEISIDDKSDKESVLKVIDDIIFNPAKIVKFEITGVNVKIQGSLSPFYYLTSDANGLKLFFKPTLITLDPNQTEPWPLVLDCKENKMVLDSGVSLLFSLEPNSEIHLDIISEKLKF